MLRFEGLIAQRDKIVRELRQFLNLPLDPAVQSLQIRDGTRFVSNTSFGDIEKPFDFHAIYRWEKQISSQEVRFASRFLRSDLEALDYEYQEVDFLEYLPFLTKLLRYRLLRSTMNCFLTMYRTVRD